MNYHTAVRLTSLVLLSIFVIIGLVTVHIGERRLAQSIDHDIAQAQMALYVLQHELEQMLVSIADLLASDREVRQLLAAGYRHVNTEGGGKGGVHAALVRASLMQRIFAQWETMEREIGLQQMHFHLVPDGTSFLRMTAFDLFGDTLSDTRKLIHEVQRDGISRTGFEIGPTFAGLRAVVPVRTSTPQMSEMFGIIGSLEVGICFSGHINRLSSYTNVGYGLLLAETVSMQRMINGHRPIKIGEDYLLASSKPELGTWLLHEILPEYDGNPQRERIVWHGQSYELLRFPFYEYVSPRISTIPAYQTVLPTQPIGSLVIWVDISKRLESFTIFRSNTLALVAGGYLFTQILVLVLLNYSRHEWQAQLDARTTEVCDLAKARDLLLKTAGEGIIGIDLKGLVTFANPCALNMLGYDKEDLVGTDHRQTFHRTHQIHECIIVATTQDGQIRRSEDAFMTAKGDLLSVMLTAAPIEQGVRRVGVVLVFHDITELKAKEARLIELATTDTLTGVANRRCFMEGLQHQYDCMQRDGNHCAVLMADLDFFKRINDVYGHAAGDIVLQHFSKLVQKNLRKIDLIGRIGGEEFAILMPGKTAEQAIPAAQRILEAVANNVVTTDQGLIQVTVSIGVSEMIPIDTNIDIALKRADHALYAAKQAGRNRVMIERI